jgi:hypothetical protein
VHRGKPRYSSCCPVVHHTQTGEYPMSTVDYVEWDVACGSSGRTQAAPVVCERRRRNVATRRDERKPTDSTVPCVTVPGDTRLLSNDWVTAAERLHMPLRSVARLLSHEAYGSYVFLRFQVDNGCHYDVAPFSTASMFAA